MHLNLTRTLVVLGSAAALAAPAAAGAKQSGKGERSERPDRQAAKGPKFKTVILKGTVASVDGSAVTVAVTKGNSRGRRFAGQQLVLDVTNARISVRDANGDGAHDVADVVADDRFVAQVRVPRGSEVDPAAALVTRRFVDKGVPEADDEPETETETETEES